MAEIKTQCCIAGGGPAGMMLAVLLARAGVDVVVLEKHRDFLRDFRGDTIHPSTLTMLHELGWLDDFLKLPHEKVYELSGTFADTTIRLADLRQLPVPAPYIAMVPQWDFLNFLADRGRSYPTFHLLMETEAKGLITEAGTVTGVRAAGPQGELQIASTVTVAADGRHSTLRPAAGLEVEDFGAPMDVLWFRLPRSLRDTDQTQGKFAAGRIFVMLNRGDYWQCAFVIAKGKDAEIRAAGLPAFRAAVGALVPFEASRTEALRSWDEIKLLTVQVNRLKRWWKPGFICIGDAAHAMSPVAGVGVNLAVQDAVAAANVLWRPMSESTVGARDLAAIEARRAFPAKVTQRLQLAIQNTVIAPTLNTAGPRKAPLAIRILTRMPLLRRLPGRLIGLGVRPEHIATPDAFASRG